jgi:hypothetical protein
MGSSRLGVGRGTETTHQKIIVTKPSDPPRFGGVLWRRLKPTPGCNAKEEEEEEEEEEEGENGGRLQKTA